MDEWPVHCFKAYDIRGHANGDGTGDLTPKFAYRLEEQWQHTLSATLLLLGETFVIHLLH